MMEVFKMRMYKKELDDCSKVTVYKVNCMDCDEYQEAYLQFVKIEKEKSKRKQRKKKGKRQKEEIYATDEKWK